MAIHKKMLDCVAALAMTVLLLVATPAFAQTFPKLSGRVVDEAHLLSAAQVVDLTSKSQALEAQSGRQLVIATVPSLEGRSIQDYGYQLGRAWGIGAKGKDDGVILLVAPAEHQVGIETGYGATAFLTDAMSSVIIRNSILPHFKQTPPDYGGGITAGADQIITQMSLPAAEAQKNVAAAEQQQRDRRDSSPGALPVLFWMVIILSFIVAMARRVGGRRFSSGMGSRGISPWVVLWGLNELGRGSRGGWGGGSGFGGGGGWGGGGGFSGGGGSFGGGGASGSW